MSGMARYRVSPTRISAVAMSPSTRYFTAILITSFIILSVVYWFISFISTKVRNGSQTVKNNLNILQVSQVVLAGRSVRSPTVQFAGNSTSS